MNLSIIIPVLNEMAQLPASIAALRPLSQRVEIIWVDGGSTDGTAEFLAEQTGFRIVHSERGRGKQLNAGAACATGDAFLFLHADCFLPENVDARIRTALAQTSVIGGAFTIQFAERNPLSLRIIARGINVRTLITKTATGDQGIFLRREIFEAIGGFAEWPFFEDVQLVAKMKEKGEFAALRAPVTISARRYLANGPWRTTFLMYALRIGYWMGIHPTKLYRWFQDVRLPKRD